MAEGHRSKPTSWATVVVLIVGFVLLGFALPLASALLFALGGLVLLIGIIMGFAFRIMEDFH